jgi:hypothetical protein
MIDRLRVDGNDQRADMSITIGIRLYGPKINNDKATDTNRQYIYYYYYYTTKVYIYIYMYANIYIYIYSVYTEIPTWSPMQR